MSPNELSSVEDRHAARKDHCGTAHNDLSSLRSHPYMIRPPGVTEEHRRHRADPPAAPVLGFCVITERAVYQTWLLLANAITHTVLHVRNVVAKRIRDGDVALQS